MWRKKGPNRIADERAVTQWTNSVKMCYATLTPRSVGMAEELKKYIDKLQLSYESIGDHRLVNIVVTNRQPTLNERIHKLSNFNCFLKISQNVDFIHLYIRWSS